MPKTKKREVTPPPTESAPPSVSSPPPSPVKTKKKKKNIVPVESDSEQVPEKPKKSGGQRLKRTLNAAKKAWQGSGSDPSAQPSEHEPSVVASVGETKKKKKTKKTKKRKPSTVEEPEPEPEPESSVPPPEDSEDMPPPEPAEEEEKPKKKKKKTKKTDDDSKKKKKKRAPTPPPEPSVVESEPPASEVSVPVSAPPSSAGSARSAEELPKASKESDGEVESGEVGATNEDPEVTRREVANMSMTGLGHMLRNEHRLRRVATPISLMPEAGPAASASGSGSDGARDVSDDGKSDAGSAPGSDHDSSPGSPIASDDEGAATKPKAGAKQNSGIGTSSDVDLTESIASFSESEPPQEEESERSVSEPESEESESKVALDVLSDHIPVFIHHSCVDMSVQKHKLLVNRKIRACKYWNYPPKTEPLLQALESAEDDEARDEIEQQLAEKRETALAEEVEAAELLKSWRRYQEDIRDVTEETQGDLDSHIENHSEALGPDLEQLVEQPSLIFEELANLWQQEFEFWEGLRDDGDTGLPKTAPYKFERVHTYPAAFRKAAVQAQLFNLRLGSRLAKIAAHARKLKDDQGTPEEREWLIDFFMDGHDKATLRDWARRLKEDISIWKGRSAVTRCRFDKKQ